MHDLDLIIHATDTNLSFLAEDHPENPDWLQIF